jgi:hypothetical protein
MEATVVATRDGGGERKRDDLWNIVRMRDGKSGRLQWLWISIQRLASSTSFLTKNTSNFGSHQMTNFST